MKKTYGIFIIVLTVLLFPPQSDAQQLNQRIRCLNVVKCMDAIYGKDKKGPTQPELCPELYARRETPDPSFQHYTYMTPKQGENNKPLPNSDTYIIECLYKNERVGDDNIRGAAIGEVYCTSGNSATDMIIFKRDNYSIIKQSLGSAVDGNRSCVEGTTNYTYAFRSLSPNTQIRQQMQQPLKSDANGNIPPVIWNSCTQNNIWRQFYIVNFFQEAPIPPPSTTSPKPSQQPGSVGGQQQGTLTFPTVIQPTLTPETGDCTAVVYDPYGKVFDSQTLEPIPNAQVELLKKRDDGRFSLMSATEIIGGNLINPQTTLMDGGFSYLVPDGTYRLRVEHPAYIFPIENELHKNAEVIYSDIYPTKTGEDIIQKGTIQHRDIPLRAKDNKGKTYPIALLSSFYDIDKTTGKAFVKGTVSHPLTKITVYSVKQQNGNLNPTRYKAIAQGKADKLGNFKLNIDQSTFESTEMFGEVELEKVDLTAATLSRNNWLWNYITSLLDTSVQAQQQKVSYKMANPILNKVEGFAYDISGQKLANATVGVYLTFSDVPYYETSANSDGFFSIDVSHLPTVPYELRYKSGNTTKTVSTAEFVVENKRYLEDNNINLNTIQNNTIAQNNKPNNTRQDNRQSVEDTTAKPANSATPGANNQSLVMIISILFILLASVGIFLALYVHKKNSNSF